MSNGLMLSFSPADRRALWLASDNSCFNSGFANRQTLKKKPWFIFVVHPLEVCILNIFGGTYSSKGITFISTKGLVSCTAHFHRARMKCTRTGEEMMKYYGFDPYHAPPEVMSTPCGHIALEVQVTHVNHIWRISVASLLTINATFTHFSIPKATANCTYNSLHIEGHDEEHYSSRFCGKRKRFTVIPNASIIMLSLVISWHFVIPDEKSTFDMFYQLTDKYKYIMLGRADFENIQTDTSLVYTISERHCIMKGEDYRASSLHFNVDIGHFVNITVFLRRLGKGTTVQAYDGPSASSYLLKEFYLLYQNESAYSFGTSLLLLVRTNSLFNTNNISITFARHTSKVKKGIILASHSKNELLVRLRESEYCSSKHSIFYCSFGVKSNMTDTYIKLEQIEINMDISFVFDCYFGSVWILDAMSAVPVWKWCGFNSMQLQQITSASQMFIIKAIFYKVNDGGAYIKMHHVLSLCPGIFVNDVSLVKILSHIITITYHGPAYFDLRQVSSRCFVVQYFHPTKQYKGIKIRGSTLHKVNEFNIIRAGKNKWLDCSDMWSVEVYGMLSARSFGHGKLYISHLIAHNRLWTNVSFRATHVTAYSKIPFACNVDEGLIIAVQNTCQDLYTDCTILEDVYEEVGELSQEVRLISACKQFTITADSHATHRFAFDSSLLCIPLVDGQRFPCKAQYSMECCVKILEIVHY